MKGDGLDGVAGHPQGARVPALTKNVIAGEIRGPIDFDLAGGADLSDEALGYAGGHARFHDPHAHGRVGGGTEFWETEDLRGRGDGRLDNGRSAVKLSVGAAHSGDGYASFAAAAGGRLEDRLVGGEWAEVVAAEDVVAT